MYVFHLSNYTQATEHLARLAYFKYVDVKSNTSIINHRRKKRLILIVKKTLNFDRLYRQNLDKRHKLIEESERNSQKSQLKK